MMNINPRYLIYHDLIGIRAHAKLKSKSSDIAFSDIGTIIDETQNMVITEKNEVEKKFIKKDHLFRFNIEDEEGTMLEVNGNKIVGLPINRLRSLKKKRWFKK